MEYQYDVFLSYRHRPLDNTITQRAFHQLESYKIPKRLREQGYSGLRRCFRDTEELAVSRILSDTIEAALRSTNYLVVVCSPDTPSSEWVDREVATFIELGRAEKIYPLLIAGDPEVSFPPSLKKVPDIMDRVMDVRAPGDGAKGITAKLELGLLKVIAAVCGCRHSDMVRQHKVRKVARMVGGRAAAVAIAAAVVLVSGGLWMAAEAYRQQAQREQAASLSMLQSLTYDLPARLADWQFTGGRISDILEGNTRQIAQIVQLSEDPQQAKAEMAANYAKLGTIQDTLGNGEPALSARRQAVELYDALYGGGQEELLPELAASWNNLALTEGRFGNPEAAEKAYEASLGLQEGLLAQDDSPEARYQLAIFYMNYGQARQGYGDYDTATRYLDDSHGMLLALHEAGYRVPSRLKLVGPASLAIDLARTAQNLGLCHLQLGQYAQAEQWLGQSEAYGRAALAERGNITYLTVVQRIHSTMASCLTQQAKYDQAEPYFEQTIAIQELLAADGQNTEAQAELAVLYNNFGLMLNMVGDFEGARPWYEKNVRLRQAMYEQSPNPEGQAAYARALYNLAENAYKEQDYALSRQVYGQCLEYYAPVAAQLGDYHHGEYLGRLAFFQIIHQQDFGAALQNAAAAVELQPQSTFLQLIFGYSLLFNGHFDAADQVFGGLAARSAGETDYVIGDFGAFAAAGLPTEHMAEIITIMQSAG